MPPAFTITFFTIFANHIVLAAARAVAAHDVHSGAVTKKPTPMKSIGALAVRIPSTECDGLASQGLGEDLHASMKPKHEVERRLLLDGVVR